MVRCPSCNHDAHETYCPHCGCEDYRPDAKPLTGQELTARQSQQKPPEVGNAGQTPSIVGNDDNCKECGHHVSSHWWVRDEAGCHMDGCGCTAAGCFPSGQCAVC